ncbi:hypothetical protein BH11VER1_BH11VER1_16370 [soil metagenome]
MNSVIEYYSNTIVTKSRGVLEYLTLGRWGRICTLDFSTGILEETTIRFTKVTMLQHRLRKFDAVDYSYQFLSEKGLHGVHNEIGVFRVGLRIAESQTIFPLAVFKGAFSSADGISGVVVSLFPDSCDGSDITHEVASRSLANMLCQKLHLKLAI